MQVDKIFIETHLVLKGQGLSDVTREPIYDDTISLRDLHDLLLDLSYCGLLENKWFIYNYHILGASVCVQMSGEQQARFLLSDNTQLAYLQGVDC